MDIKYNNLNENLKNLPRNFSAGREILLLGCLGVNQDTSSVFVFQ